MVRHKYGSEGEVSLKVGGVRVEGVLIDSGASFNLIDYKTWSYLKQNLVVCQSAQSEKKIFAYDKKNQLTLLEHLQQRLCVRGMEKRASMSLH